MQSVSFRIWTRVIESISYDDNHYTMVTSNTYGFEMVENNFLQPAIIVTSKWRVENCV